MTGSEEEMLYAGLFLFLKFDFSATVILNQYVVCEAIISNTNEADKQNKNKKYVPLVNVII